VTDDKVGIEGVYTGIFLGGEVPARSVIQEMAIV
jgi:hypothetical protein